MPVKTSLAGDKIDAPAACTIPFRPYCGGIVTRMRNVSKYMLVLALCLVIVVVTFCMRRSLDEIYIGHTHLSVCLSLAAFPHYCTDLYVTWGNGRGCPLVVHYWADLQSVHGFHCYDSIVRT